MLVKARHQGNSIVLTIPKSLKVKADTEFEVIKDKMGNIIYKPINRPKYDIWSDHKYNDLNYDELLNQEYKDLGYNPRELKPIGRERIND